MRTPRWPAALLVTALLLSSAPGSVLAAPSIPAPQQTPSVASAPSYLLILTPPSVSIPAQVRGFDAGGYINIEHARRYTEVQTLLEALQAQGAISGFAAMPSAYAFTVRSPDSEAQAALAQFGRLQITGEVSAAAVDELSAIYQRQLTAALPNSDLRPQLTQPAQPPPFSARPQPAVVAPWNLLNATAVTGPIFSVNLNSSTVAGYGVASGTVVSFTLKTGSGALKGSAITAADDNGNVYATLSDIYGSFANAAAGDVLEVQAPDLISIPIVNLLALPDSAAGRITGFGPPDIASPDCNILPNLELQIGGGGCVATTATGAFTAENLSLAPWYSGWLVYTNQQGHRVQLSFAMPVLAARGNHGPWSSDAYVGPSYVSGAVLAPDAPVTVTLVRGGSPLVVNATRSWSGGWFSLSLSDLYGNPVPILAGDTVRASDGLITTTLAVNSFTVVSDPTANTVSGMTDAAVVTDTVDLSQTLSLWPASDSAASYGKTVLTPGGSFSASNPFYWYTIPDAGSTDLDWGPGQQGFLRYLDAQGNALFDAFRAFSPEPILRLRGNEYSYSADAYVEGYADGFCGYGAVTLLDAANAVKDQDIVYACPSFSTSFADVYGNPLPILDGDSVTANLDGRTATVKAPSLSMSANPQTDVVAGAITPGLVVTTTLGAPQSLAVYGDNYSGSATNVQPDATGKFNADFAGILDIGSGAWGFAKYIDANGSSVFARWQAPFDRPVLHLRGYQGYTAENFVAVSLPGFSCSSEGIDLVVKSQDGAVRGQELVPVCGSFTSLFLHDVFGGAVNLNAGDVVQATFAGQSAVATMPSFDVTSDAQSDTVFGVTNAEVVTTTAYLTQTLAVWPRATEDSAIGKHVELAVGNAFNAANPFYYAADPTTWIENLDWDAGAQGHLRYIDAAGNLVYATFAAKVDQPLLTIQKDSNQVSGQLPESNAPVTVTIKSGATVKGIGYAASSLAGSFAMNIFDGAGNPLEIAEGDEIVLSPSLVTVTVPPLSANADIETDRITGRGPANTLLNVYIFNSFNRSVATDANGDYALNLRGFADVRSSDLVGVEYKNAQGHLIRFERYAGTSIAAVLNTNRVWGYLAQTQLPVTVSVKRDGALIGVDSFFNKRSFFAAFPVSATGQPVSLTAGDVVEVQLGASPARSLTLPMLSLAVNEQTNQVSGVAPANSLLGLTVAATPQWYEATVPTAAFGQWSVDLTTQSRDIRPGDIAFVRYSTNGSDTAWLYGVAPVFWLRDGSDHYIHGYAAPYAPVTITLKRKGAVLAVAYLEADGNGLYNHYLYDGNGLAANVEAGDVVEVKAVQTTSVAAPTMQIVVNSQDRTISGVGPANSLLALNSDAGSRTIRTDASGAFSVSFATQASGLSWAQLRYREPQGNWIYATARQFTGDTALLQARWDSYNSEYTPYAVSGRAGAGLRQIALSLRRRGQVVASARASGLGRSGNFSAEFRDGSGNTVDILGGDDIEMTAGDVARSMTVPPLTAQANTASRTLFGSGPPNARVYSDSCGESVVDAGSAWVIQCSGEPDRAGFVYVTDLQGNSTYLGWSTPHIWVREYGNQVDGTSALGAQVQVQLLRGAAVLAQASTVADFGNGGFIVRFFSAGGNPLIIQPDDVVVVNAGQPITVPVTPLTAVIDADTDAITGLGPADAELEVDTLTGATYLTRRVTVAADGSYMADFAGAADIRPGDPFHVTYKNAASNGVWLGWRAPLVRINLGSEIVDGYTTPNTTASLVLKRGGVIVATAQAQSGADGEFSAFFLDSASNLVDLAAGDLVEITASPTVAAAAITLTASLDMLNDTVAGNGPAGAPILAVAHRCDASGCNNAWLTVLVDKAGAYIANFAGFMDLDETSYAYVQASDAAGNQTSITTEPVATPRRTLAEERILAEGASLLMSASGTANWNDLTPPQAVNATGGGRLIFYAVGGNLVITAPDGVLTRPGSTYYVVEHARAGQWQVQIQSQGSRGAQYAVAAGAAQYTLYLPGIQQK